MRTDRRTDMTKLIVAFRNFANASNNERVKLHPDCEHTHGTLKVNLRYTQGTITVRKIIHYLYFNAATRSNGCS
jgi:hypothetical protein